MIAVASWFASPVLSGLISTALFFLLYKKVLTQVSMVSFFAHLSTEHRVLSELLWSLTVRRCPSVCPLRTSVRQMSVCPPSVHSFLVNSLASTNSNQSAPNLVKVYLTIRSWMSMIMEMDGLELLNSGVLCGFQQYFSHIPAIAHIIHVFPWFHQYKTGALKCLTQGYFHEKSRGSSAAQTQDPLFTSQTLYHSAKQDPCFLFVCIEYLSLRDDLLVLLLLLMTKKAFVDCVDQDQTAQNMQSDLWSTLSTFSF